MHGGWDRHRHHPPALAPRLSSTPTKSVPAPTFLHGRRRPGKRELPPERFARARVFRDLPEQARRMGESQRAPMGTALTPLGEVLLELAPGRSCPGGITIFDSSGIGLQDLNLGLALLKKLDMTP
ncbi:hypothetical protein [Streptomyces sp. NPDC056663]|uniref:hypothetical protein n=1 Tax=Streptomyces sp. NPDC056663 TaxID=3345899 RepID=UPI003693F6C6